MQNDYFLKILASNRTFFYLHSETTNNHYFLENEALKEPFLPNPDNLLISIKYLKTK